MPNVVSISKSKLDPIKSNISRVEAAICYGSSYYPHNFVTTTTLPRFLEQRTLFKEAGGSQRQYKYTKQRQENTSPFGSQVISISPCMAIEDSRPLPSHTRVICTRLKLPHMVKRFPADSQVSNSGALLNSILLQKQIGISEKFSTVDRAFLHLN